MKCKEITDFIMAYLDNELEVETRRTFEYHLGKCPACVTFLDSYKRSISLGREAFTCPENRPASAHVPEGLIKAILEATRDASHRDARPDAPPSPGPGA